LKFKKIEVIVPKENDTEAPTIEIISPQADAEYRNDAILEIDYEVSDNVSSQENIEVNMFFDGEETQKNNIDLSLQTLGAHTVRVTAKDEAQNESQKQVEFFAKATYASIIANTKHYHDLSLIKDTQTKRKLIKATKLLERIDVFIEKNKNNEKLSKKQKLRIVRYFEKRYNYFVQRIVNFIQRKAQHEGIQEPADQYLIEQFESLKK